MRQEGRDIGRDCRGHAALATAAANESPSLSHTPLRRLARAGYSRESLELIGVELEAKGGLEGNEPRAPALGRAAGSSACKAGSCNALSMPPIERGLLMRGASFS